MTNDEEDRPTGPRVIRPDQLLRLIEENGGPKDLDLRGAVFVGEGREDKPTLNPIDLTPEALAPSAKAYGPKHPFAPHPWWLSYPSAGIYLGGAQLQGAEFYGAQLQGASLYGAHLQGARLDRAQLQEADLWGTQLKGTFLNEAKLQGASLSSAQLQEADLWGTQLQGAYLSGAQLQEADLWNANLEGAYLGNANLEGAELKGAHVQHVDLHDVDSLEGAHWYGALLDHTQIKGEHLGKAIGDELTADEEKKSYKYHRAKEAYLLLKNNFNQIGRYEDASWAYVKEQQMERMAYYWEWRERGWPRRGWGAFRSWLRNWAYELSTGYGERPWNAVGLGGVIMAAFAGGYRATGAVSAGRPRWFTSWNPGDIDWAGLGDSVTYSLATFATFNLGRTALNPEGRAVEIFSSVEALLGIGVLALVVFTLGNRMSRG